MREGVRVGCARKEEKTHDKQETKADDNDSAGLGLLLLWMRVKVGKKIWWNLNRPEWRE